MYENIKNIKNIKNCKNLMESILGQISAAFQTFCLNSCLSEILICS